jgi:prolyl-tRNA editing enzyme YbaK/EbsC (Cys-tRNA(Pro) deacylase)
LPRLSNRNCNRSEREAAAPFPRLSGVHPNCLAVDAVLEAGAARGRVQLLPDAAPTAAAAAAQLGVEVGAIANSLVFATAEGEAVLILTSGAHRVDTAKAAALLGTSALLRATPDLVRAATGQPIGGVAPLAHPAPLQTLVDVALANFPQIWAAGGVPHAVFPTTYEELLRLTGARAAAVA